MQEQVEDFFYGTQNIRIGRVMEELWNRYANVCTSEELLLLKYSDSYIVEFSVYGRWGVGKFIIFMLLEC